MSAAVFSSGGDHAIAPKSVPRDSSGPSAPTGNAPWETASGHRLTPKTATVIGYSGSFGWGSKLYTGSLGGSAGISKSPVPDLCAHFCILSLIMNSASSVLFARLSWYARSSCKLQVRWYTGTAGRNSATVVSTSLAVHFVFILVVNGVCPRPPSAKLGKRLE